MWKYCKVMKCGVKTVAKCVVHNMLFYDVANNYKISRWLFFVLVKLVKQIYNSEILTLVYIFFKLE